VLVLRSDGTLPVVLMDGLRDELGQASTVWPGLCDVYVYSVGRGSGARPELIVRVSVGETVVPLLFRESDVPSGRLAATVRGVLKEAVV
jgi:hypothetical protein